jgi:glutamate synthase domain-containing protein 3
MNITAGLMHFKELNEQVRNTPQKHITIEKCLGQRYIASGLSNKTITINGTPGNALGAYLNGADVVVNGNAQDATGDTMNEGSIIIHGSSGDATGYAMRGGKIFVRDNAGYRAGIHMKAYEEKVPVLVIGGKAGSFLGEYQAGGTIVVLGINCEKDTAPVGNFCGTGMHGGKIFIRTEHLPEHLPAQVSAKKASAEDIDEIRDLLSEYCDNFDYDLNKIISTSFYVLTPNSQNPYKRLYTHN